MTLWARVKAYLAVPEPAVFSPETWGPALDCGDRSDSYFTDWRDGKTYCSACYSQKDGR